MNDRPPMLQTIEDWKRRYQNIIPVGSTDEDIIQQIQGDGCISYAERQAILAEWNSRPEQVDKLKRKEKNELTLMIIIVIFIIIAGGYFFLPFLFSMR
ncbi:MAG TPA: hypothetical protein PLS49_02785 [Candidatus Woesebacteria bacterium]|nr:hypothetical protein [Candidatus Woesebacteria bacterium]